MDSTRQPVASGSHPIRTLLLLGILFVVGLECTRYFHFTISLLNYLFSWAVLCIPFFALRSVAQLPRVPKVIGFFLVSPLLLFSLLIITMSVACDFDLHPYSKTSCVQELQRIDQNGYSVHFIRDGCGGAAQSFTLDVEQRMILVPGLYAFRSVDFFDGAYEGSMTLVGPDQVQIRIPKGVEGSGWNRVVDRVYVLKRHLYF